MHGYCKQATCRGPRCIHTSVQGVLTFGGTGTTTVNVTPTNVTPMPAAITGHPNLGLTNGSVYEIAVFQAQRQTKASSYQLSLPAFAARKCLQACLWRHEPGGFTRATMQQR